MKQSYVNKQTRTQQGPVNLKGMQTTTIQSEDEVQQVKSTTLRLIGYLQWIRNYLKMSYKSMFRNILLCLLILGFSNSKVSNPDNCPISMQDGIDLKHKSSFSFASITRAMFNDYISPRLEAFMCFPVHSQKTENTFHDKDNAAYKDPPVAEERNSNLGQDDSSLETLYAKDEKEASTDPIHNKTMVHEYDRYASFEKYEDKMDSISYSTSRLAFKGFYYNLEKRLCICFACGVEVKQLNETESVEETHRKLSPDCKFISGKDTVNIPFHKLAGCCEWRMHRGGESSESNSIAGAGACSEELIEQTDRLSKFENNQDASNTETYTQLSLETATGVQQTKPRDDCMVLAENAKYPVYSSKSERTASFLCWRPTDIVSTSSLVDAGLYYTGSGDEVRCFQCGGGLKNWVANNDPWAEHAYWFPSCQYVMHYKGQEFIEMVKVTRARLDVTKQERHMSQNLTTGAQYAITGTTAHNNLTSYELPRERTSSEESDRALITRFIEMGFGRDHVLLAFRKIKQNESEGLSSLQNEVLEYLLHNIVPQQTDISPPTPTKPSMKINGTLNDKSRNGTKTDSTSEIGMKDVAEENYALQQQITCKVCMDSDACVVFLPCGHMVTCEKCAGALRKCAICRARIQGNVRAIIS